MDKLSVTVSFLNHNINELTPDILASCLKHFAVLSPDQDPKQIAEIYFANTDHGFSHSQAVWNRCQQIINQSPLLWRLATLSLDELVARKVLLLAAIFHDLGRFLDAKFEDHELVGAKLASNVMVGYKLEFYIHLAIINHDYICPLINGYDMPEAIMHPLSEIFRLADKTSISPKDEVRRYHEIGRRLSPEIPFFDPTIPDEDRFNFRRQQKDDELTWMLAIFALQSTDFVYGETCDAYADWARGKRGALKEIEILCLEQEYLEGGIAVDPDEAKNVVRRFCHNYGLLLIV